MPLKQCQACCDIKLTTVTFPLYYYISSQEYVVRVVWDFLVCFVALVSSGETCKIEGGCYLSMRHPGSPLTGLSERRTGRCNLEDNQRLSVDAPGCWPAHVPTQSNSIFHLVTGAICLHSLFLHQYLVVFAILWS